LLIIINRKSKTKSYEKNIPHGQVSVTKGIVGYGKDRVVHKQGATGTALSFMMSVTA